MKKVSANYQKFVYLLIAVHLAIALPLSFALNIWIDEASTLYTTQNIAHAFSNALQDEKQAPLYFWILSVWRTLSDSLFFARIFSVICSLAAIRIFADLAQKYFSGGILYFVTAFFALHPYLFWASVEIRVYSLVILLSVLLLKLFDEGYLNQTSEKPTRARILYTLFSIIALYTNYYLGFLLVANFFVLLSQRKFKLAQKYFLQMMLVGLIFLPLLWAIKTQFAANSEGFFGEKTLGEGLRILWNIFLTFALPTELFPVEQITPISFFRLWLMRFAVIFGTIAVFLNRHRLEKIHGIYSIICAIIFGFILLAYFLLGPVYVENRHAALLLAPLVIFLWSFIQIFAAAIEEKSVKLRQVVSVLTGFFLAFFFVYAIFAIYPDFTKRGDWARIAAFIEANETPNQPIIIYKTFDALALPNHYAGKNSIYPDERFFEWNLEADPASAEAHRRQIEFIISEIPPEAAEIWLVTDSSCPAEVSCQPLENFIQENYTVIQQKDFYEENVRLLRKNVK